MMNLTEVAITDPPLLDAPDSGRAQPANLSASAKEISVALMTGGIDPHYAFGLSMALASRGVRLDVIGSKEMESPEMRKPSNLTFRNLYGGSRQNAAFSARLLLLVLCYARLIRYAATAHPKIFHILWNYRAELFDRTLLMLYYKVLGKKIVLTAHNVNAGERDGNDSLLNRWSLRIQYHLADHIFVHTDKMRNELVEDFGVNPAAVSVIPFGINNAVPHGALTPAEAKIRVGVTSSERTILFYGRIRAYKGLEYLVGAFDLLAGQNDKYRLIIAGELKKESQQYWRELQQRITERQLGQRIIQQIRFIPDEETELYFKSADVLVLPYTQIFQSGVLFLAYSFGLPVIATDVGSFRGEIVEGETGYVCRAGDSEDLARTIARYFESSLFHSLDQGRVKIKAFAERRNSWKAVGDKTLSVYAGLLQAAQD